MLHPQAQALLRLIEEKGIPPTHTLSPREAREFYRVRRAVTQPEPPEVTQVSELKAGDIPLRYYRPAGSAAADVLPVLVYYHGGGWVIGDLDTHDTLCRQLANGSGCAVVAVDYRMGPEHRYPAAVDDALAAARWVHDNAAGLKLDAKRMAVGGDSAGGNLAAVTALAFREGGPKLAFQLLIYPATDQRRGWPSHQANGQGYLLEKATMDYFISHYIDDRKHYLDWRASPLLHTDHRNLPPAFVLVAGYDPLHDEGVAYAQKLSEAGSRASLVNFDRQIHGFITMGKVIDEANTAVQLCASQLRLALA
ncbi:alpha/beta hydrolase [Ramlibacter humi]|uniref:Alpha/beta hydrolase n=1 Tax=Ramlibacter humi TaxID=2530451 RepID=A0A4Z0CER9_9BURK|nr:alpha/beta hydrolase [Ramlibacter humi]TFZ08879.1 alpha/beta hydrolase [Ramlibacter humi]